MYKGIYLALSGAILKQMQLETISQNVANASTAAYKKELLSFRDYLIPQDTASVEPDGRVMSTLAARTTDFTDGPRVQTGSTLDIAIEGDGFFALEGDRYTRRGDLKRDRDGYITAWNGAKVLGNGGPIQLPDDAANITIGSDGRVFSINRDASSVEIDTLRVVRFPSTDDLVPLGDGMYRSSAPGTQLTEGIMQGYLESSNVNAVTEMIRMIEASREFESYQKIIQTFDEATAKVNNDLGRI